MTTTPLAPERGVDLRDGPRGGVGWLSLVVAVTSMVAAVLGLTLDGAYGEDAATVEMLRGYDAVTLAMVGPALLVTLRAERRGGLNARVVAAGLLAIVLGAMWAVACLAYALDGTVPAGSSLVESDTVVHLGIVLDLTLLVPLYGAAAVLLWRHVGGGYALAGLALVAGTLHQVSYAVALLFQHAADVPGSVPVDPVEPWIVLLYVVATALLLSPRRSGRATAR